MHEGPAAPDLTREQAKIKNGKGQTPAGARMKPVHNNLGAILCCVDGSPQETMLLALARSAGAPVVLNSTATSTAQHRHEVGGEIHHNRYL